MRSCSVDYDGIKIQDNIATFETFSMYTMLAKSVCCFIR